MTAAVSARAREGVGDAPHRFLTLPPYSDGIFSSCYYYIYVFFFFYAMALEYSVLRTATAALVSTTNDGGGGPLHIIVIIIIKTSSTASRTNQSQNLIQLFSLPSSDNLHTHARARAHTTRRLEREKKHTLFLKKKKNFIHDRFARRR